MFLDNTISFSSAQTLLTSATTTLVSTTTYDVTGAGVGTDDNMLSGMLGSTGAAQPTGFDIGAGDGIVRPSVFWNIGTAVNTSGTGTLTVTLQAAVDNGSNVPGTWVTVYTSRVYTASELVANYFNSFPIPPVPSDFGITGPRFYRMNYVVGTATFSAGTISANIVINPSNITKIQTIPGNYTA